MTKLKNVFVLLLFCSLFPCAATHASAVPTPSLSAATSSQVPETITPTLAPDGSFTITRNHLVYKILSSGGNATVVSCDGTITGNVTIPRSFTENQKQYTVTEIAENAFAGQHAITAITLPSSLIKIWAKAFAGCTGLEKITIPASVNEIDMSAWEQCTSLSKFYVKNGNKKYDSDANGFLYNENQTILYRVPLAAETADLPSTVTHIADGAMQDCTLLTSIFIPESVTNIDEHAFLSSKDALPSCPNALISVRPNSFALQYAKSHGMRFHVQYRNGDIVSADNGTCELRITYPADGTESGTAVYYHCPANAGLEVLIPANVIIQGEKYELTGVAENAFRDAPNVRKIRLSSSINTVEYNAFLGHRKKTIYINVRKGTGSIQTALSLQSDNKNSYHVKVAKGSYTERICIPSNTTLDMRSGAILKRSGSAGCMIVLGSYGPKYSAGNNITILGGTIDAGTQAAGVTTVCGFSHVKNIRIEGTTFKYLPKKKATRNAHMIEFGGAKNVLIKNCRFLGNKYHWKNNEAIQLESTCNEKKLLGYTSVTGVRDGTQCGNVTIQSCYFRGYRYGCGSNHLSKKDHFTNMKFIKNTFVGASKYAICLYGYRNVTIRGNKLKKSGSLYQNQFSTNIKVSK